MAGWLKYVIAFASAFVVMLLVRTLAISIHGVLGDGLSPLYKNGDCLLINRCSYGLRIAGNGLLPYSRLWRQPVKKGDVVVFTVPNDSVDGIFIARCTAVPGDTVLTINGQMTVPGLVNCAKTDYYWLSAINQQNPIDSRYLGFIPESDIIGRVVTVLYNTRHLLP